MSDLDRLMKQVEELKALANRQDDAWMQRMSNDELLALGKRVRKVADGLSGLQGRLQRSLPQSSTRPVMPQRAAAGSLGSMARRDTGAAGGTHHAPPPARPPVQNPFPMPQSGLDMNNPMQRRRVGGSSIPREAPPPSRPAWQAGQPRKPEAPPGRHRGYRPPL